jgi:hypothetical protein
MHGKCCHEHTTHWPNLPIKCKFADRNRTAHDGNCTVRHQDSQCNTKVKECSTFMNRCWRETNYDSAFGGPREIAIEHCSTHSIPRFAYCGIWQANYVHAGKPLTEIGLNVHDETFNASNHHSAGSSQTH